jgi:hypothetical protein
MRIITIEIFMKETVGIIMKITEIITEIIMKIMVITTNQ